jgi:hypothetical protein
MSRRSSAADVRGGCYMDLVSIVLVILGWEALRYGVARAVLARARQEMLEECNRCGASVPDVGEHMRRCRDAQVSRRASEHVEKVHRRYAREEVP